MDIREDLTLGIDLGIGSCGWALIRRWMGGGEIVALGVRTFDVPETDKERTPTNQLRRGHRGLRRVLRRRRKRMTELRRLFAEVGLISSARPDALKSPALDPWRLRAEGLDRRLTGAELAVALGHIAKHRGFKSNRKSERGANKADESSKMLSAIAATQERMQGHYRTVGEMFARDAEFAGRKRNRDDGKFTRSILRDDQADEVGELFRAQRRLGNAAASDELEQRFGQIAFFQRPLQDSEHLVGLCPFEPEEKRAARRSYSFEQFRFLSRLAALRLEIGTDPPRKLDHEQIALVRGRFGRQKKTSYNELRKILGLGDDVRFADVAAEAEGNDFVARTGAGAEGTGTLRNVVQDSVSEMAWLALLHRPEALDRIAAVLSFREDIDSIREGLAELELAPDVLDALMHGVEAGKFRAFSRAGHISAKACRNIIPYLAEGLVYSDACEAAGYRHTNRRQPELDGAGVHETVKALGAWVAGEIGSPVARKALIEAVKQVSAVIAKHGLPGHIHVELAREVGKSKEERDEITRGIERRNKEKDRLRAHFRDEIGREPQSAEDLLRFELWKEQNGFCLYCGEAMPNNASAAGDNLFQVDHILPWSRSGDDSFVNKTLCHTTCNQNKRGATPYRWFGSTDEGRWAKFVAQVETNKMMKGRKKRNYLLKDDSVLEEKFKPRNLQDTKYATRLLLDLLKALYTDGGEQRVMSRPGPLTDRLRRGWGIQGLKKGPDGKRIPDDRHHAIDALIVAATSQAELQKLILRFQESEAKGDHRDFRGLEPP